uniref:INCENP_ARK-bind domain-containing protein n=1 Tax=Parastrongyloides trichosuri TaxID=131310 RepID=A0A0N4Z487_PARTI
MKANSMMMNRVIRSTSKKNIFRKLENPYEENIGNKEIFDNVLTNIRNKEIKTKSSDMSNENKEHGSSHITSLNNVTDKIDNNFNIPKFFIGDDEEENISLKSNYYDFISDITKKNSLNNILSKSVLDITTYSEKKLSPFHSYQSLNDIKNRKTFFSNKEINRWNNLHSIDEGSKKEVREQEVNNKKLAVDNNLLSSSTKFNRSINKKATNLLQHVLKSNVQAIGQEDCEKIENVHCGLKRSHSHLSLKSLVNA